MNYLGIDYGEKRIGLSFGDEIGVAVPIAALTQPSLKDRLNALAEVIKTRRISALVIGYPYNMDGSAGFKAREVDAFIERLEARFRLPVHRVDERLTSHQAQADLRQQGRSTRSDRKVRKSGDIDSRAAALILQDYLNQQAPAEMFPFPEDES